MQARSHQDGVSGHDAADAAAYSSGFDVTAGVAGQPASSAEWLSSFMDAEAAHPGDRLPDALLSVQGRERWDTYHLIGDVLRTPELAQPVSSDFHVRLFAALEQEAPIIAAPRRSSQPRGFMKRYGLPGMAAAAAVASVTWMAQPYFGAQPDTGSFVASVPGNARGGMVTPVSAPGAQVDAQGELSLAEYLDAHRQVSGQSGVRQVSSPYQPEVLQR